MHANIYRSNNEFVRVYGEQHLELLALMLIADRFECATRARERSEPSYIFVNNRLEGNAPQTIEAIVE